MDCRIGCPAGYVCHCYHALPPGFFWVLLVAAIIGALVGVTLAIWIMRRDDRKRDSDTRPKDGDAKQDSTRE